MPTCPVCGAAHRTSDPHGALWAARKLPSLTPPCLLEAVRSDLATQSHDLARGINGLRTGLRAFEGAMAAPDTVLAIRQRQQVRRFLRVIGFLQSTINCRQASRAHELVVDSHRRAGAHADAAFDAVLEANEARQVVWQFDLFGLHHGSEIVDT